MRENYIDLCCFDFGKRSYVIMKNSVKIMFFEKVNDNYEMPILSFDLYDNVGKSLTVVNQNFFMSQLVNRLNIAFNKGIIRTDDELRKFLNGIKLKIEGDIYLIKLFKGSLMSKIDEENYESNKKELIKYLDQFKIGMFVNYNNVSIFNGSLDKGSASVEVLDSDVTNTSLVSDSEVGLSNNEVLNSDSGVSSFDNFISGSNDEENSITSNDYFSSLGNVSSHDNQVSQNDVSLQNNQVTQNSVSSQNNISYVDEVRKRLENNF